MNPSLSKVNTKVNMGNALNKKQKTKNITPTEQTTLNSNFRYIDGRRFHNNEGSKYFFPNDDEELDRLHLQHFLVRHVFLSNFFAPIDHILNSDGSKVLDVGCGAGSWMLEMASSYPKTEFTGIDISPVQPCCIRPKNVTFICTNLLSGLPFENATFDYVFQRFLSTGIPSDRWPDVVRELTRVLKPGGYLELVEFSPFYKLGPVSSKVFNAGGEFFAKQNIDFNILYKLRSLVEQDDRLEDVNEEQRVIYYGAKAGKLGQAAVDNTKIGLNSIRSLFLTILETTSEEFDETINIITRELREYNSYKHIIRVYACKKENI